MYSHNRQVLHLVDEAKHFSAAVFLKSNKSIEVWKTILRCWPWFYCFVLQDFLRIPQGSNCVSKDEEFLDPLDAYGISAMPADTKSANMMSHVERYHSCIRTACNKIRLYFPRIESDYDSIYMNL